MIPRQNLIARFALCLSLCLALCLAVASTASAQVEVTEPPFDFYTRGPYRANVPRPQSILRFDIGEFHTNYAMMERVITSIAEAASDRMRVTDIGLTNEYRQMHLVVLSAPENIQRLDQIKANIARLSDPRTLTAAESRSITEATPVVVWLNYTIHGNESASFEAMLQVIYQLAASEEPATLEMLRNCIVLINTGANPDGHERFVTWYNSYGIGNPEPLAGEHREPWSVYGRVNRFRFDLNRDNIASTQRETRNMQRAYLEWNPQIFVDLHGQPSQYFFPPAALPINPNLPPEQTSRWLTAFGRANAAEFDRRAWSFYVRDIFDLFYPGYWDSWPSLNGATGMTYETDGGGFKGLRWRRDDGSIVTLRSSIAKHFVTSLATLNTAAQNRAARLNDYYEFRRTAIEEGRREQMRRVILPPASDPGRAAELVEVLLRAGIEVRVARASFRAARAHAYGGANATASAREFPAGSIVIDLAQPQKRLAKALLEPDTPLDEAFVREQLARFARNERRSRSGQREEYGFYDVTAWALPFVFGVEAFWTEDAPEINAEQFRLSANPDVVMTSTEDANLSATNPRSLIRSGVTGGRAQVAYLIPYDRNTAGALALRLQQEDFRLAVATRPLTANGREWPRGTIVVRVGRNTERLHERIAQLSTELGVEVISVNTGFTETGEVSVGSETVVSLRRPRIIVVADDPVDQTSYGAIWWMFDRYGIEFTPMTINTLRRAELDRYNVIILPDGSPGGYFSSFGESGIATLRGWCQRGGTLVAIKGAAVFAAIREVNLTSARLVGSDEDEEGRRTAAAAASGEAQAQPSPSPSPQTEGGNTAEQAAARRGSQQTATEERRIEANQTERLEGAAPILPPIASPSSRPGQVPEGVPGAIMRATIDRTTPMTYGYDAPTLPVLVNSGYFFRPSREGTNAVVFSSQNPNDTFRIAGFIWPNNTERLLRNTTYVFEESVGRGHVVLYAEDPNFRGFWFSTTRLFFNSFLFQPTF
jgi:hypothetical protein